jgi:hypothetical protein
MNAYIRFKLALTEDEPTVKPYMEDRWADTAEVQSTPLEISLSMLESLHDRWVRLLRSLQPADWKRTFRHPELGTVSLERNLALYAWHGKHHVAHITELRKRWAGKAELESPFPVARGCDSCGRQPRPERLLAPVPDKSE